MSLRAARRPLRLFALWRGIGWGLIAAVVVLSLVPQAPDIPMPEGDKWGHAAGYAALMLWFTQLYERPAHWRLGLAVIALGIALECAQGLTSYRSFEFWDMVADGAGALTGWLLGGTAVGSLLQRLVGQRPPLQQHG